MLSRKPQKISETDWYYEEQAGIEIIHEVHMGHWVQTDHIKIPWRKLEKSIERWKASKEKRS